MKLYTGEILFQPLDEEILLCLIDKFFGRYPNWMYEETKKENLKKLFVTDEFDKKHKLINIKTSNNYEHIKSSLKNQYKIDEVVHEKHEQFKSFIQYLLKIDHKERPNAEMALNHEFFNINFDD